MTSPMLEVEHQLPVSRGGIDDGNTVSACAPCNDLKGPLSLEEFRQGLAERIGTDVVFAGEATPDHAATPLAGRVRSLAGDRSVVRLDPAVGEELQAAWRYLRSTESPEIDAARPGLGLHQRRSCRHARCPRPLQSLA